MKVWLKRIGITLLVLLLLVGAFIGIFFYKVSHGLPFYETDIPEIEFKEGKLAVLLFSKTNGFNHKEAIIESKKVFHEMADGNDWFLYETDEAGVFNAEQLAKFDVVIWNNVSGKVLTDEQRVNFQSYLEGGGGYLGIHAAGDFSHHWQWYYDHVLGTEFSHHSMNPHIQAATLELQESVDSLSKTILPESFVQDDEWYVFHSDPREKGAEILYAMDGNKIVSNGNMLWIKDKDFGMGEFHPNIWSMNVGQGKAIYAAPGHSKESFRNKDFIKTLHYSILAVSK